MSFSLSHSEELISDSLLLSCADFVAWLETLHVLITPDIVPKACLKGAVFFFPIGLYRNV